MKKLVSWLLVAVMVLSLAACGGSPSSTEPAGTEGESQSTTTSTPGQLIYGVTTSMTGDMGMQQWSSSGADKPIMFLINAYSPTCYDQDGHWDWDPTVVASHESVTNEDGSATYTITLNEGLKFNDGSEINAKHYLAYYLLFASPVAVGVSAYGTAGKEIVGQEAYRTGESSVFSGLRLIDDLTFSVTIGPDYNPYYYGLALLKMYPMAYTQWLPEGNWDVVDDGEGAYFKGDVDFTVENCGDAMTAGRYVYEGRLCSGPYYLESLDVGSGEAILRINDQYLGNFEGQKASIETIVVRSINTATMLDALQTGSVDLIDGIGEGELINACLDLEEAGGFGTNMYKYNGYMKIFFQCDWGPTQFENVRKAIAYLTNREQMTQDATLGYGNVTNGQYSFADWMAQETEERLASELEAYAYSPETAVQLLKDDGWVYSVDTSSNTVSDYVDGSGEVRWKQVSEEETAYMEDSCVQIDGQWYMPLILKYLGHAEGDGIETVLDELITMYLVENENTTNAGMQIDRTVMADAELLSYLNRRGANGESKYEEPSYNMISLASGLGTAKFDKSYCWTFDETQMANNKNRYFNHTLDDLSMNMLYGVEAGDDETFLDLWFQYQQEFNRTLPEVPLFNWTYCAAFNDKLEGFEETNIWSFEYAILYATLNE